MERPAKRKFLIEVLISFCPAIFLGIGFSKTGNPLIVIAAILLIESAFLGFICILVESILDTVDYYRKTKMILGCLTHFTISYLLHAAKLIIFAIIPAMMVSLLLETLATHGPEDLMNAPSNSVLTFLIGVLVVAVVSVPIHLVCYKTIKNRSADA